MITLQQTERIVQSTAQKLNRISLNNKFRQIAMIIAFCPHVPLRACPLEIQLAPPNKKNPLLKMTVAQCSACTAVGCRTCPLLQPLEHPLQDKFGCLEWEFEFYRRIMLARCYLFNMRGHCFHKLERRSCVGCTLSPSIYSICGMHTGNPMFIQYLSLYCRTGHCGQWSLFLHIPLAL